MWCKNCRQDVPAVASATDESKCCIRCGAQLADAPAPRGQSVPEPAAVGGSPRYTLHAPLSAFDTWGLEEQLRHVDRILSGARFSVEVPQPHGSHAAASTSPIATSRDPVRARRAKLRARAAWTIAGLGAAALACGVVLLAAGALLGRAAWQSLGLPVTLLGQVALLLGMMMQLDLVWQGKRETASKLYRFQKRLVDLEALAAEIEPDANDEPSADSERELMAELKTRLDMLSHRLNVPCG